MRLMDLQLNCLFLFVFSCSAAFGSDGVLQFDPSPIAMSPKIDDLAGTYTCKVTNISKEKIVGMDFKGGCGCIEHILPVTALAPGESTNLTVVFQFKDYVGPQKRKLVLMTKTEGAEPVRNEVLLIGDIPTPLTFSKKAAIWLYGEKAEAKEITVKVKDEYKVENLRVEDPSANRFINIESTFDEKAQVLSIKVSPISTDIAVISPTEKANFQLPYIVKYRLPSGVERYERFWVIIAKRQNQAVDIGKSATTPESSK